MTMFLVYVLNNAWNTLILKKLKSQETSACLGYQLIILKIDK